MITTVASLCLCVSLILALPFTSVSSAFFGCSVKWLYAELSVFQAYQPVTMKPVVKSRAWSPTPAFEGQCASLSRD